MIPQKLVRLGALGLIAAVSPGMRGSLVAQNTQTAQEQVTLAFGYVCEDKYVVRNDGARNVELEFGAPGSTQRTPLHLKGKDAVEIPFSSAGSLELRMNGSVVATAQNENKQCPQAEPIAEQAPVVVVRPLDERDYVAVAQPAYGGYAAASPTYIVSQPVIVAPLSYYDYYLPYRAISAVTPIVTRIGGGYYNGGYSSGGYYNRSEAVTRNPVGVRSTGRWRAPAQPRDSGNAYRPAPTYTGGQYRSSGVEPRRGRAPRAAEPAHASTTNRGAGVSHGSGTTRGSGTSRGSSSGSQRSGEGHHRR